MSNLLATAALLVNPQGQIEKPSGHNFSFWE